MGLHVAFGALTTKVRRLKIRESKRGHNLGILTWKWVVFQIQGGIWRVLLIHKRGLPNPTKSIIEGVGLSPHPLLEALVNPYDSRLVMGVHHWSKAP